MLLTFQNVLVNSDIRLDFMIKNVMSCKVNICEIIVQQNTRYYTGNIPRYFTKIPVYRGIFYFTGSQAYS